MYESLTRVIFLTRRTNTLSSSLGTSAEQLSMGEFSRLLKTMEGITLFSDVLHLRARVTRGSFIIFRLFANIELEPAAT